MHPFKAAAGANLPPSILSCWRAAHPLFPTSPRKQNRSCAWLRRPRRRNSGFRVNPGLRVERVTVGLPFCELCENVNNFSGKFLPATAIREKTLSSSTLTGSRARKMIVSILPAA